MGTWALIRAGMVPIRTQRAFYSLLRYTTLGSPGEVGSRPDQAHSVPGRSRGSPSSFCMLVMQSIWEPMTGNFILAPGHIMRVKPLTYTYTGGCLQWGPYRMHL